MSRKHSKARKRAQPDTDAIDGPTPEQEARAQFRRQLQTEHKVSPYKRWPSIDTLLDRKILTDREYAALAHYSDQANLAERSPVRSCCDNSPRGDGRGPGVAILSAQIETGRLERELGSLMDIARAIAVRDLSLADWCIEKWGGRERYNGKGEFVAIVPINEKRHMDLARVEIKMAARRIMGA